MAALVFGSLAWLLVPVPASATVTGAIADVHPPIGVLGDVAHAQGSVMFSYRYQRQDLRGLMIGTTDVTTPIPGFTVVPSSMNVNTNLFEVMWAPLVRCTHCTRGASVAAVVASWYCGKMT